MDDPTGPDDTAERAERTERRKGVDDPLAWTPLGGERVLDTRWLRVRAARFRAPDGSEIAPWYLLEYGDWANAVVFDAEERVVMVRLYRPGAGRVGLEIPGGIVAPGDPDPRVGAARELREETGYEAPRWESLGDFSPNAASHTNRVHFLLARGARRVAERDLDAEEFIGVETLTVAEVRRAILAGEIDQVMHVAALLLAFERLGV